MPEMMAGLYSATSIFCSSGYTSILRIIYELILHQTKRLPTSREMNTRLTMNLSSHKIVREVTLAHHDKRRHQFNSGASLLLSNQSGMPLERGDRHRSHNRIKDCADVQSSAFSRKLSGSQRSVSNTHFEFWLGLSHTILQQRCSRVSFMLKFSGSPFSASR